MTMMERMGSSLQKIRKTGLLPIMLPQLLLIAVVAVLFVYVVRACLTFTKGPVSNTALKDYLLRLQEKLRSGGPVNPEEERVEAELLQNGIKAGCHREVISANTELEALYRSNRQAVDQMVRNKEVANRISWIDLQATLAGFDELYYPAK